MGTVYKPTYTKPLPATAEAITRKGKRIAFRTAQESRLTAMNPEPGRELSEGILHGDPHGGAGRVETPPGVTVFSAAAEIFCRFPEPGPFIL
jgi:hypothetical protein